MNLQWSDSGLLSEKTEKQRSLTSANDARNAFENDYNRIVFSSPFRRLQDKAQVFPLETSDFVRTRLTHSIEVSAIAKSIGISVEKELIANGKMDEKDKGKIPMILASAGLAHDLGNPPFGHFGEETIKRVFKEKFERDLITENENNKGSKNIELSDLQKEDLLNFDGNCQTIRLLTRLQCLNDEWGLHLTFATLSTLMKYPMDALKGNKDNVNDDIAYKKFGYFTSERAACESILKGVGTFVEEGVAVRHPLAFLLEAADDIAYSAADLEDGFKKKVINFENIEEVFQGQDEVLQKLKTYKENNKYGSREKAIQQFRIYLQGKMISAVTDKFIKEQEVLLRGEYKKDILLDSTAREIRKGLKKLAKRFILDNDDIHKTELAGESIISFLLRFFIDALATDEVVDSIIQSKGIVYSKALDQRQKRVYNLISIDYRKVYEYKINELINDMGDLPEELEKLRTNVLYYTYILITDFISCMTDNYSLELYRRLKGISIK